MAKDIAMTKKNKKNSFLEWAESTDRQIYRETDDYVRSLRALYDDAIDAMDGKIYKYLSQIADEDGTSLAEAKRWLSGEERRAFQLSLEEFKRKSIAAIGDSALDKEVRQMSRRARISYLQAIQLSLKTELAKLMDAEEKRLFNHLRESYETKYYHELYGMARMTAPEPIQKVNGEAINRLIGRHWHVDGKDVSDRLSARSKNTIALLEREIGQNLAMGKSQDEVIRTVAKNMNRSFRGAATLVQTETASILTQAAKDSYTRYGLEEYQLSATLDLKTSEICQEMDRKHFPMKDMKQGINAPPFHPNCRTAIMPYFGDDLQRRMQAEVGRMARDPVTGKSVRVGDLSYKEWYNKYVKEQAGAKSKIKISGAITDLTSDRAIDHAELYYKEIRKQTTDVARIAKNTGYQESTIQEIKNYLFIDKHQLKDGIRRFDPDFVIAQSWQRLAQNEMKPHDMTLIRHEIHERELLKKGMTQDEAHRETSKIYNYKKEAGDYYVKLEERKKRR